MSGRAVRSQLAVADEFLREWIEVRQGARDDKEGVGVALKVDIVKSVTLLAQFLRVTNVRHLFESNEAAADNIDRGKTASAEPHGAPDFASRHDQRIQVLAR